LRTSFALLVAASLCVACGSHSAKTETSPKRVSRGSRTSDDDSRDDQDKRITRLELRLLEKEAQVEDLQDRLEDARAEVVRAMAKVRTVASRAEAASGMAEAEVILQSLKSSGAQSSETAQVTSLVNQSANEFDKENYGGALYLANQAKALASSYRWRAAEGSRESARPGETSFALPLKLKVTSRGNVRQGPGTTFAVAYSVESGAPLIGFAFSDEWIRVNDDGGRSGWIYKGLVARP
jgi:uncharacterized protein YgiM (DUF1202 family)